MSKIFTKSQLRIIIVLAVLAILAFIYRCCAYSFENDWYNLEYKNYMKSPDSYSVQEVTIDDIIWYSGSNDPALTYTDFFKCAVFEVTYAGGQTETYRAAAKSSDKKGDRIKVAYDADFDTRYDEAIRGVHRTEGIYLCIPRTEVINNHTVSGIAAAVSVLLFVSAVGYAAICCKKNKGA